MARFQSVRGNSRIVLDAKTNLHPLQTISYEIDSVFEVNLLENGLPDPAYPVSGRVEVDVDSLKSNNPLYDQTMKDVLNPRRYPRVVAEVKELRARGEEGRYFALGNITYRDISRPVEGKLTISKADSQTLRIAGDLNLDVQLFNIVPPKVVMLKVFPIITITLTLFAKRLDG